MYAIIRTQKHKSMAAIARSGRHTFRQQTTLNADPDINNPVIGCKSAEAVLSKLKEKLPLGRRKDAVLCIEYLITASPEAFKRHGGHLDELGNGYFKDALNWLNQRHGKSNVISAVVHRDETTPHLVAYVVPITKDGRLSARDFLGGPKLMRAMQDSFHSACAASRGLLRGVRGSKAKHQTISSFYEALDTDEQVPALEAFDYMMKAVGRETMAWRDAQSTSQANQQHKLIHERQRKGIAARNKVLELKEKNLDLAEVKLKHAEQALIQRESDLANRESEVLRRQPELLIEKAKTQGLERIIQQYQHDDLSLTPQNSHKKRYRSELSM